MYNHSDMNLVSSILSTAGPASGFSNSKKCISSNSRLLSKNPNDTFFNSGDQLLYLIDFGISTPYIGNDGKLLSQKVMRNIRCSP